MSDSWRLFIALPLSEAVRKGLSAYQRALAGAGVRARWVKESQFHITLKFLGDVRSADVPALVESVLEKVRSLPAFEVTLRGVGAFPDGRTPQVLWAALAGASERLFRLAGHIEEGCALLGFPRSERPFHPHVTLGRLRPGDAPPGWKRTADNLASTPLGPDRVSRVVLYRSRLAPSGPTYTELASALLAPE